MSRDDCLLALERFSKRVVREAEWTWGQPFYDFAPHGHITVTFLVHGSFGVADDIFEAIRVQGDVALLGTDRTQFENALPES